MRFSDSALHAMRAYAWPGNVRELENAIERAAILCDGVEIGAELLALAPAAEKPRETTEIGQRAGTPRTAEEEDDNTSLEDYFVRFVLDHEDQMTETEIAQRLGISRKSLWERRQRLGIPRKRTRNRGPRSARASAAENLGEGSNRSRNV